MILDNLVKIRYRIRAAAQRSGRDPDAVSLVAVTKYAGVESIKEALGSGLVKELGENRVQEALVRKQTLGATAIAAWRLIGHLQTNKCKQALAIFDAIDSLDSLRLAEILDKEAAAVNRVLPILVQVKLSKKETQSGVEPEQLPGFLRDSKRYEHLDIKGLMTIAPALEPPEACRPYFRRMRGLFDDFFSDVPGARLSMGMSRDFEVAVEEGATDVRIGSGIFS